MCGVQIGAKRLAAVPWARFCVSCQELAEREELADKPMIRDITEDEAEEAAAKPSPAPVSSSDEEEE